MAQATNRADKVQPCMQIRENELEVSVTSGNIFFFGLTPSRRVRGSASFPNLRKRCLHLRVRENCEVSFINIYIYIVILYCCSVRVLSIMIQCIQRVECGQFSEQATVQRWKRRTSKSYFVKSKFLDLFCSRRQSSRQDIHCWYSRLLTSLPSIPHP